MRGQNTAACKNTDQLLPLGNVKPSHDNQRQGKRNDADGHSIPHQRQSAQRDQTPEDAGPPSQKNGQMQQNQGVDFFLFAL